MDTQTYESQDTARVLVVDDEGPNRYSVGKTLQRVGHIVMEAASGEEALEHLAENNFDVVLTDIRMEGIDGVELLRRIKEQTPDAIVILMTGYASLDTAVEALRLGAHDYLIKPSSSLDIRASVAKGVERARNLRRRRLLLETLKKDVFELSRTDEEVSVPVADLSNPPERPILAQANLPDADESDRDDFQRLFDALKAAHEQAAQERVARGDTDDLDPDDTEAIDIDALTAADLETDDYEDDGVDEDGKPRKRKKTSRDPISAMRRAVIPSMMNGTSMQLGPITVFPGRYQISVNTKLIDLTPTEFDLLLYLAAHRGRVVPCHELVREVRGYAIEESEAREVVRPHVSNLRRKLKDAGQSADLIINVRGIGYRLSERAVEQGQ